MPFFPAVVAFHSADASFVDYEAHPLRAVDCFVHPPVQVVHSAFFLQVVVPFSTELASQCVFIIHVPPV